MMRLVEAIGVSSGAVTVQQAEKGPVKVHRAMSENKKTIKMLFKSNRTGSKQSKSAQGESELVST